jgi:FK506-binding protein 4/5
LCLQAGKFHIAKKYYSKIVDLLKSEDAVKDEEASKRQTLLLAAHLNLAMCYLKQSSDAEVIQSCDEALKLDPKNEKGLFRRGMVGISRVVLSSAFYEFRNAHGFNLSSDPT